MCCLWHYSYIYVALFNRMVCSFESVCTCILSFSASQTSILYQLSVWSDLKMETSFKEFHGLQ